MSSRKSILPPGFFQSRWTIGGIVLHGITALVFAAYLGNEEGFLDLVLNAEPLLRAIWFGNPEDFDAEIYGLKLVFWAAGIASSLGFLFYVIAIRKLRED